MKSLPKSLARRWQGRARAVCTAVLALTLVGSAGCASLVKSPTIMLADVQVSSIGLTGATLRVQLDVYNPNRFGLDSKALDYTLFYATAEDTDDRSSSSAPRRDDASPSEGGAGGVPEWQRLAVGRTAEDVALPAGDTSRVALEVPFEYRDVGPALLGLLRSGSLDYRFEGAFSVGSPVGTIRVPFDRTGRFGG